MAARPTQLDVARRAGVSRALVSLVMREAPNVSDATRLRVLEAARELGYRPNAFARSLASKQSRTIGVFVNDITNPFFGAVFASLSTAARAAGYDVLTAPGTRLAKQEISLVSTLLEHQVAGLALMSPLMSTRQIRQVSETHPTVVLSREVDVPGVDVVATDETAAADALVARLVELGHRHVVHVSGGANRPARDREKSLARALRHHGLEPSVVPGSFVEDGGRQAAFRLLEQSHLPTAVVAANDLVAVGVMGVLHTAGIRVPDDVSVVGFDDSPVAGLEIIGLTTVRQHIDELGEVALASLLGRIEEPGRPRRVRLLGSELVERRTLGPAPSRRVRVPRAARRLLTS